MMSTNDNTLEEKIKEVKKKLGIKAGIKESDVKKIFLKEFIVTKIEKLKIASVPNNPLALKRINKSSRCFMLLDDFLSMYREYEKNIINMLDTYMENGIITIFSNNDYFTYLNSEDEVIQELYNRIGSDKNLSAVVQIFRYAQTSCDLEIKDNNNYDTLINNLRKVIKEKKWKGIKKTKAQNKKSQKLDSNQCWEGHYMIDTSGGTHNPIVEPEYKTKKEKKEKQLANSAKEYTCPKMLDEMEVKLLCMLLHCKNGHKLLKSEDKKTYKLLKKYYNLLCDNKNLYISEQFVNSDGILVCGLTGKVISYDYISGCNGREYLVELCHGDSRNVFNLKFDKNQNIFISNHRTDNVFWGIHFANMAQGDLSVYQIEENILEWAEKIKERREEEESEEESEYESGEESEEESVSDLEKSETDSESKMENKSNKNNGLSYNNMNISQKLDENLSSDDNKLDKLDENMNNMNLSVNKIEDKSVESQSSIFFKKGDKYLKKFLTTEEYDTLSKNLKIVEENNTDKTNIADEFTTEYRNIVKKKYQLEDSPNYNKELYNFVKNNNKKVKILWGNCLDHLKNLPSESIHLMVTSPPYYNARDYSIWENLQKYLDDMRIIIKESYRVLDNHRVFVFNIGDIFGNDNMTVKSVWGKRRLPLSAYLIKIFEECGFTFVDDFIWNKGEPQSQRQFSPPYPLYQYPVNSYEHILIFHKHRLDKTKFPCSVCGCLHVSGNSQSEIGVQSWECKNPDCTQKSKSNRGKRFSLKTIITQNKKRQEDNEIPKDLIKMWRKDILKFSPVIKINSKGKNTLGHTAPFPENIPEMAVRFYTYKNELVLDPFGGSMTSAIVANRLDRIGIGSELRDDLFKDCIIKNIKSKKMLCEEFDMSSNNDV